MIKSRLEIHHGHKQHLSHFDHTTTTSTSTTTPTTTTTITTTKYTTRRAATTKMGPNDAKRVVWTLGECFLIISFVFYCH